MNTEHHPDCYHRCKFYFDEENNKKIKNTKIWFICYSLSLHFKVYLMNTSTQNIIQIIIIVVIIILMKKTIDIVKKPKIRFIWYSLSLPFKVNLRTYKLVTPPHKTSSRFFSLFIYYKASSAKNCRQYH